MIPIYQYRVQDNSVVLPFFKKWMVTPFFRFIPWWIPANIITILSNMLMYGALYMALTGFSGRFVFIPLLILFYAIGDHLDGMQARQTKTSSPLGEFCDHFLDIFNNGILLYIVCLLFNISSTALIAFFLMAGYLTHAVIFFEQFTTKWLRFGKISALESVLMLAACILVSAIDRVYGFALTPFFCGLTIVETLFILASMGAFFTFVQIVWRTRATDIGFWEFCAFLIAVGCLSTILLQPVAIFYVITAYSGLYISNLQRGHLADGKKRLPDFAVPLFMALAFAFEPLRQPTFLWGLYIYLACRTLWIAGNAFLTLSKFGYGKILKYYNINQ